MSEVPEPTTIQINDDVDKAVPEKPDELQIDLKERDPNHMNDLVRVTFHEIIGEPHPEVFAFDSVWVTSYKVFRLTKLWCYRISTLLCAVPLAFIWGIQFALLACCTVWIYRPCVRAVEVQVWCFRGFLKAFLDSLCRPCIEMYGYIFYNIRVRLVKGEDKETF